MPARDLDLLIDVARAAGEIGLSHFQSDPEIWEKSDGQGPVTEADLAIDTLLRGSLLAERPDYGWLSEETEDDDARLGRDAVFIVDPIDGTRAFIEGSKNWAHSIAIARGGVVTEAVVFMPAKDTLYAAEKGEGATVNGAAMQVSMPASPPHVLVTKPNMQPKFWPGGVPDLNRAFRSSLAYRLAAVGAGAFDGMLTLRPTWEWDVAAGVLLIEEAGGQVSDMHGAAPRFNNPHPTLAGIVAAGPSLHADLVGRLTAPRSS